MGTERMLSTEWYIDKKDDNAKGQVASIVCNLRASKVNTVVYVEGMGVNKHHQWSCGK